MMLRKSMLTVISTLTIVLGFSLSISAQTWVQVTGANFQTYLFSNYPAAMSTVGSDVFIDADHASVLAETSLDLGGLGLLDLTGIEAFINLETLDIAFTNVSILPQLPPNLIEFVANGADLTSVPILPNSLERLVLTSNPVNSLPAVLPASLQELICAQTGLTSLPPLPAGLTELSCGNNSISSLPALPTGLELLSVLSNNISSLPALPASLYHLNCGANNLTSLPTLPPNLEILYCYTNSITALPTLPSSLYSLNCSNNLLTDLPDLPAWMNTLSIGTNQINCLDEIPIMVSSLQLSPNPITCLPNYVSVMSLAELAMPLCQSNDPIDNPNLCPNVDGILGHVFKDTSNNCIDDAYIVSGVPVRLEDNLNNLLLLTNTALNGLYMFPIVEGNYLASIDTTSMPNGVVVTCPPSFVQAVSNVGVGVSENNDFGLQCAGFDLGVQSMIPIGMIFPGEQHELIISAGDLSNYYGLQCATGVSGEVSISVSGPADTIAFLGAPISYTDTSAVYFVSDFAGIPLDFFEVLVTTDTTAQEDDLFQVIVNISTGIPGDLEPQNDLDTFYYSVINSYDPNMKVTSPEMVEPLYDDEFMYTIYFQNTGSAPAINIRLEDQLDVKLDLNSFKVVAASDPYNVHIDAATRKLTVRYPNIMLPDSASSQLESIGYIQYSMRPSALYPNGTTIENTASIYFDYNPPIITNTTSNLFLSTVGIEEEYTNQLILYPNPVSETVTIKSGLKIDHLEIVSLDGRMHKALSPSLNQVLLPVSEFPEGIYLARIHTSQGLQVVRFIVVSQSPN